MDELFKINQIVEIEIEEGSDFSGSYRTRVEDIRENSLVLGMPMENSNYVPLRPGSEVIVWHWDDSASHAFYCKVKERIREPIPLIFLEWPPFKTKKIQRRNFVRVPVNLPLDFAIDGQSEKEEFKKVLIRDLSGGGAQFISKTRLVKGDILKIRLFLPQKTIECKAKVMWVYTEKIDKRERYLVGIKYLDISEKTQDQIIEYVFQRQRELIQKGVF
jgi:c-di-GMP-binding flagellar brake protein YcgR